MRATGKLFLRMTRRQYPCPYVPVYVFLWLMVAVESHCPNHCSGHGVCDCNDACVCDRQFGQGDCSVRWCPSDYAFVTTPQGDFNMDGDRFDNSFKPIRRRVPGDALDGTVLSGSMGELQDVLTLHEATGHILDVELTVGDQILIDNSVFSIKKIVSTGVAYQLNRRINESFAYRPISRYLTTPYGGSFGNDKAKGPSTFPTCMPPVARSYPFNHSPPVGSPMFNSRMGIIRTADSAVVARLDARGEMVEPVTDSQHTCVDEAFIRQLASGLQWNRDDGYIELMPIAIVFTEN